MSIPVGTTQTFLPIVTLTMREDGRWGMDFDWSSSATDESYGPGGEEFDQCSQACDAVDDWVHKQPTKFVIPAMHDNSL